MSWSVGDWNQMAMFNNSLFMLFNYLPNIQYKRMRLYCIRDIVKGWTCCKRIILELLDVWAVCGRHNIARITINSKKTENYVIFYTPTYYRKDQIKINEKLMTEAANCCWTKREMLWKMLILQLINILL